MGYKQMDQNMTFAEIDLMTSMEHNRSLKMMEKINQIIDWSEIEAFLLKHYTVGNTIEGADAYPPVMLMKAFLLQKWFRIHSDPELESHDLRQSRRLDFMNRSKRSDYEPPEGGYSSNIIS